jgi:hypothetical protein
MPTTDMPTTDMPTTDMPTTDMPTTESSYAVYWPRGRRTTAARALAPRPRSLEGKTVAFLWDYMFRGDEIWPELKTGLAARYPGIRFIDYDTFGSTHGEDEHTILATLPERIATLGIDAIVSGMGC